MGEVENIEQFSRKAACDPDRFKAWLIDLLSDENKRKELADILPEVAELEGVGQRSDYHAEGDVLTHTRLTLEALPANCDERLVWAALLHDIGKPATTNEQNGTLRSPGHDVLGAEMAKEFLERSGRSDIAEDVFWLVRHHMFCLGWQIKGRKLTRRQQRFCQHPLFGLLVDLVRADARASLGSNKETYLDRILDAHIQSRQ
ncbi:MAG: HD domain-containing protein [Syntrophotalea sp.]|uniref:HD domain-containing protein n=1 Tax=Syntrophotalea sp. TaxID=2812029 RepID=UPI003D09EFA8